MPVRSLLRTLNIPSQFDGDRRWVAQLSEQYALEPPRRQRSLLEELAGRLNSIFDRLQDAAVEDLRMETDILVGLLDGISFPDDLSTMAIAARRRLQAAASREEYQAAARAVSDLMGQLRGKLDSEKRDIEEFLIHLGSRLQDFESTAVQADGSLAAHQRLGAQFDRDLALRQLDQVKELVQRYRHDESDIVVRMRTEMMSLRNQVIEMECVVESLREQVHLERARALHDQLTGVPNRTAYDLYVTSLAKNGRRDNLPHALIVCDIDHFKRINDEYGHQMGDAVLKAFGGVLAGQLRTTDFVARYGGEEFVVILKGATEADALQVAEKLRQAVAETPFGISRPVTASFGICEFQDAQTIDKAFEEADQALYAAKRAGRNCCMLASGAQADLAPL